MSRRIVETLTWVMVLVLLCYTCYGIGKTSTAIKFADKVIEILSEEVKEKAFESFEEVE